jgi:hypothetical protein
MLRDAKWPKTAIALSNRLVRAIPSLRERGVCVTRAREGNDRSRMIHIRLDNRAANPSASSASSATETDRYEDQADTTAQIEEARSVDRQRVDPPVLEEGESVDIDVEGNVIETPPPGSPAPATNTADAVSSNAPEIKRYIAIRKPQKKVSETQVSNRETVDADPSTKKFA